MNHERFHQKETASTVAASVSSIIFSIIASSHHWLHAVILLVLGSSSNMIAMSDILWLRRVMVTATLITTIFSIYRLIKHKHMPIWMKGMSYVSILISFGFIIYTIIQFGWLL